MSTIYRVTAHLAKPQETLRRIDHGVSSNREYALWLAARSAARLSKDECEPRAVLPAIDRAATSSQARGAPQSVSYDYGTVTILVLTDERQEQLRRLADGDSFMIPNEDIEAMDLGAHFDDGIIENEGAVSWAAKERLTQVAPLLSHRSDDVEEPMRPAPVYIVHEASGSAYWLDEGYLMACPLARSGELRTEESVQVEFTEPEHEPAMHFVREALSALSRPTPKSNPDLFEVFAADRVDWIGAPVYTERATYIPIMFADGYVGYAVNSPTGDRQEYLYFNPSSGEDAVDPNVFVYQGPVGQPDQDGAVHHYLVLEDQVEGPPKPHGDMPAAALRQATMRTAGEGRIPEERLKELVSEFGDDQAKAVSRRGDEDTHHGS